MRNLGLGPLYPITATRNSLGLGHLGLARLFLDAGIRFFQVREKTKGTRPLLEELIRIQRLCAVRDAVLVVNDRLDLAMAAGAGGVHLGREDLSAEAARRVVGRSLLIGVSTHSAEEFQAAQAMDVDYVAIGPIYDSPTKPGAHAVLGAPLAARLASRKRHPMVAIGGIDVERARRLWDSGVDSVAVISDLLESPDPAARIEEFLRAADR